MEGFRNTHSYEDIMGRPRPVSPTHPPMSLHDRAAQFLPFAALTGYEAAIQETARLTEERIELEEDEKAALDEKLQAIETSAGAQKEIAVTWFCPDEKKAGGAYVTSVGVVKKVDALARCLILQDQTRIPIRDIIEIS